jgi:phosphoribosylformylglycinamidine synthase
MRMVASPNLCDKTWVTEQYDRYVLGNTVLAQPEDAGVLRIDERTGLGIALSVDGNGRYARLDPYRGAQLALAESYRNVAVTGARPVAITNCLNFGSPEDPQVMWQFAEAVRGLADGAVELGIPVTGGNVSFYNQTGGLAINPTPVLGVLGVLANVAERVSSGLRSDGDLLFLLGETRPELSGTEWAWVMHNHLGGRPPQLDFAREKQLAAVISEAARLGHLAAAHDLSDGGLAQSLAEACLRHNVGARVTLPADADPFILLFSESTGRALVAVPRGHEKAFVALVEQHALPCTPLGVTGGAALDVRGQFGIPLDELRTAWSSTLPALFGELPLTEPPGYADSGTFAGFPIEESADVSAEPVYLDLVIESEPDDEESSDGVAGGDGVADVAPGDSEPEAVVPAPRETGPGDPVAVAEDGSEPADES